MAWRRVNVIAKRLVLTEHTSHHLSGFFLKDIEYLLHALELDDLVTVFGWEGAASEKSSQDIYFYPGGKRRWVR